MNNQEKKKLLVLTLCMSVIISVFFAGCSSNSKVTEPLSAQTVKKVNALMGDLNETASEDVKAKLEQSVNEAEIYRAEREAKGVYKVSDSENELWKKITALLDEETIRQLGKDDYEEDKPGPTLDHGKELMMNLKRAVTKQDWEKLNNLRNEYFESEENDKNEYNKDVQLEIKNIIDMYEGLDSDALALNLLDSKDQKSLGILKITPNFDVVYQKGSENGLKNLDIKEQEKLKTIWKQTIAVLPKELFANFKYFKIGGDGEAGMVAYVIPLDSEGRDWCMAVDPEDITDDGTFPYTAVHEMAHYLSFNENQVEYVTGEYYPLDRYRDDESVARESSYLQAFYKKFWKDIRNDWATDTENRYFYYRHQSQFVTEYSSTNCAEDFAESFSAYVFLQNAKTPAIQEKLDFFDSYPELKALKISILKNIKDNNIYVNPEIEPE